MNILNVVDSAASLFSKKIHITLMDEKGQHTISTHSVDAALLPASFNKPTVLDIGDKKWQVIKAETISSGNYWRSPRILLYVTPADSFQFGGNSSVPTLAPLPDADTPDVPPLFSDYTLLIPQDQWLQLEFLPGENIEQIQEINTAIENIMNAPGGNNHLLGYSTVHIRNTRDSYPLEIPFDDFCTYINPGKKGNVSVQNNRFIQKGFALQSNIYNYYGIADNGIIRKLAIQAFDCVDEEFTDLLVKYNLVFADWCNASIIAF